LSLAAAGSHGEQCSHGAKQGAAMSDETTKNENPDPRNGRETNGTAMFATTPAAETQLLQAAAIPALD
jgi:hypothetical protein